MPPKQTRRSISVSRATYLRLKAYCEDTNQSMSGVTTKALYALLDEKGVPEPTEAEIKTTADAPVPDADFMVLVCDPKDHPKPKVLLPVESPEEFSKRFDHLRVENPEKFNKDPYHVEVSRKKAPEPVKPVEEMEKPELLRRQIERDRVKRLEDIKLAAKRKAKIAEERAIATAGGIFTF